MSSDEEDLADMSDFSVCGINCGTCEYRASKGCHGCRASEGRIFWGECELYSCCREKGLEHCGKCKSFPCDKLKEWAAQENDDRIANLRILNGKV